MIRRSASVSLASNSASNAGSSTAAVAAIAQFDRVATRSPSPARDDEDDGGGPASGSGGAIPQSSAGSNSGTPALVLGVARHSITSARRPLMMGGASPDEDEGTAQLLSNGAKRLAVFHAALTSPLPLPPASSIDPTFLPGGASPYTTDHQYRTPQPRSATELALHAIVQRPDATPAEVAKLLSLASASQPRDMVRASAVDIALRNRRHDIVEAILPYPYLHFCYCGPVGVAAELGDAAAVTRLLSDARLDPNTNCPVRHAVRGRHLVVLRILLDHPRINPNRGFALYDAIMAHDVEAARMLLDHPKTFVNKMTPGYGTNPLGAAILAGNEEVFCSLLTHPRVDVNRGFTQTPLQLCASKGRTHFARMLLSRPTVAVNRTLGIDKTPLELAIEGGHTDLVELLLKDTRTNVPLRLISDLEEANNVEMLQRLSDTTEFKMGPLWNRRCLLAPVSVIFLAMSALLDLRFIVLAVQVNVTAAIMLLILRTLAGLVVSWLLFRHPSLNSPYPRVLAAVPFIPAFEIAVNYGLFSTLMSNRPNLYTRERCYFTLKIAVALRVLFMVLPSAFVEVATLAVALGDTSANFMLVNTGVVCTVLNIGCCVVAWMLRRDRFFPSTFDDGTSASSSTSSGVALGPGAASQHQQHHQLKAASFADHAVAIVIGSAEGGKPVRRSAYATLETD